jgi:hypothetical protein
MSKSISNSHILERTFQEIPSLPLPSSIFSFKLTSSTSFQISTINNNAVKNISFSLNKKYRIQNTCKITDVLPPIMVTKYGNWLPLPTKHKLAEREIKCSSITILAIKLLPQVSFIWVWCHAFSVVPCTSCCIYVVSCFQCSSTCLLWY